MHIALQRLTLVFLHLAFCEAIHITQQGALDISRKDANHFASASGRFHEDKEDDISELSVDLVANAKRHLSFLKKVHQWSGGELYKTSPTLACAVWRYKTKWIPLLKELRNNTGSSLNQKVVPPIDVAWIWHVHRLSSAAYAKFSKNHGLDTDASDGAFQLQVAPDSDEDADAKATRRKWQQLHGENSPFFVETKNLPGECPGVSYLETAKDIPAASFFVGATERQGKFLWNYLAPNYNNDDFLQQSEARYVRFVRLYGQNPQESLVPSHPVDLMWHTHILSSPQKYAQDVQRLTGPGVRLLAHNDNVPEGKLKGGFKRTLELWADAYGSSKYRNFLIGDSNHGGMSRGAPPEEYWRGVLPVPVVTEASFLQSSAGCSSGCAGKGGPSGGDAGCETDGMKPRDFPSSLLQSSAGCSSGCANKGGGGGDAGCETDGLKPQSLLQSAGCDGTHGGDDNGGGCVADGFRHASAGCDGTHGGGDDNGGCTTDGFRHASAGCTNDGSGNCNTDLPPHGFTNFRQASAGCTNDGSGNCNTDLPR